MGNEAIARGALEAGVSVVTGYPGTPSSEIVQNLARVADDRNLYVEWSVNEKVALEVSAAASFSGLKSLCAMKQVGVNVAADFLLHLTECGTRGAIVLISCEDPGALSSTNEGDSRPYAKMMEFPLVEPGDFQEAKDMTKWALELSQEINNLIMLRSVTRMSHASGNVILGKLPEVTANARFHCNGDIMDPLQGPVLTFPGLVDAMRRRQLDRLKQAVELFESCPFNTYSGPDDPELLIITSSVCTLYCREAMDLVGGTGRVGLLKLGTTWPLPARLLEKHLGSTGRVLIVEEGTPFLEDNVKALSAELARKIGTKEFFGRKDDTLPPVNELNPDLVTEGVAKILKKSYRPVPQEYSRKADEAASRGAPPRALTFCPGCPHRASYWLLHKALKMNNRKGFVCGDIGCYTLGAIACGFNTLKTSHAMGSGAGIASGFGKLARFGMNQPVMAVCGDSTFFHAVMPALVNAVHNESDMILVVMDNSGTAMTGFQPHPGTPLDAAGESLPALDIPKICEAMGARVVVCDPFDFETSQRTILDLLEDCSGVRVLVMQQACALSPEKKGTKRYRMEVAGGICLGENCGCNRLCTRVFKCPGLIWDAINKRTGIDEIMCVGCGVCSDVCPAGAITRKEAASNEPA
jgi:indolepyruvate ferredoxin oxidoreductase alpha subunit